MTTPNPDVVEAVAGSLCAWFERTQDAHNEKFPVVCSFHKDEAEALLHDLASQGIELVKRGDVPPWMKEVQPRFGALAAQYVNTEGTADE